jgi:hypothetical protein
LFVCCRHFDGDIEEEVMPGKKHLRGVGSKEQRQYEHMKENSEKASCGSGRMHGIKAA